jgi:hypothetical protein
MSWSLVMAFMFYLPFRLFVPLIVCVRSLNALTMASAGEIVGCVMYLCLK